MKCTEYIYVLNSRYEDVMRVYFEEERGIIKKFVIQYTSLINGKRKSIMRVDSCHGYPHQHIHHLKKRERLVKWNIPMNVAYTRAYKLIRRQYQKLKENYLFAK